MDALDRFLLPLYQDLDGVSRAGEVARVGALARKLVAPSRDLELLIRFYVLGKWLEKVGNLSRTMLAAGGVTEGELRATAVSIRRLEAPVTEAERAVAAAIAVDGGGVRGLAERFARARREGSSVAEVARAALEENALPDWIDARAAAWLQSRRQERAAFCRRLLDELALADILADRGIASTISVSS
jgi:hypothetical protein